VIVWEIDTKYNIHMKSIVFKLDEDSNKMKTNNDQDFHNVSIVGNSREIGIDDNQISCNPSNSNANLN